jgi:Rrf2 family protein
MLSIKRETDYAIRAIYYLALKKDVVTMVDEIAREMQISKSFLAKIVQKLNRAGLVKSFVGMKGGCSLAKEPEGISFHDVIVAIEGPMAMNTCTVKKEECSLSKDCVVHPVWVTVRRDVESILKSNNFGKLLP